MNDKIVFNWNGSSYMVESEGNPILLPTGEVLVGDGWQIEIYPPKPGNLTLLYKVELTSETSIEDLAEKLQANLAVKVIIVKVRSCPNKCDTEVLGKYCPHCGSEIEVNILITPVEINQREEARVDNNFCSRCGNQIQPGQKLIFCQRCGSKLVLDPD